MHFLSVLTDRVSAISYSKGCVPLPDVWKSCVPSCCFSVPYCKGLWKSLWILKGFFGTNPGMFGNFFFIRVQWHFCSGYWLICFAFRAHNGLHSRMFSTCSKSDLDVSLSMGITSCLQGAPSVSVSCVLLVLVLQCYNIMLQMRLWTDFPPHVCTCAKRSCTHITEFQGVTITTITIYFINPSRKLKLLFDCTMNLSQ